MIAGGTEPSGAGYRKSEPNRDKIGRVRRDESGVTGHMNSQRYIVLRYTQSHRSTINRWI